MDVVLLGCLTSRSSLYLIFSLVKWQGFDCCVNTVSLGRESFRIDP